MCLVEVVASDRYFVEVVDGSGVRSNEVVDWNTCMLVDTIIML